MLRFVSHKPQPDVMGENDSDEFFHLCVLDRSFGRPQPFFFLHPRRPFSYWEFIHFAAIDFQ